MPKLRGFNEIPAAYRLLSVHELARYLGVSESWVHKARVYGAAPVATVIGNRVRFAWHDIQKWLDTRKQRTTSDKVGLHLDKNSEISDDTRSTEGGQVAPTKSAR